MNDVQTCGTCSHRKRGECRIHPATRAPDGGGVWPKVEEEEPGCSRWHRISTGEDRRTPDDRRGDPR